MRTIKSLSYSALVAYETDPETFFLQRLAGDRVDREPQSLPAAIGSAFDAYEKSSLALALFGPDRPASLDFAALFEAQVEPANRDQVLVDGKKLWDAYVASGQHGDLLAELEQSDETPRLEFERLVDVGGVPVTTKPDLSYSLGGRRVILDWKCRSYYSKSGASPTQGYRRVRTGFTTQPPKPDAPPHKKFRPLELETLLHDGCLSEFSEAYADQTSLYSWAGGGEIGSEFLAAIDEIVCRPGSIRVAELRSRVSPAHQRELVKRLQRCWQSLSTGHVFTDLSYEDSLIRQEMLERAAAQMTGADGAYFARQGKKSWY